MKDCLNLLGNIFEDIFYNNCKRKLARGMFEWFHIMLAVCDVGVHLNKEILMGHLLTSAISVFCDSSIGHT